VGLTKREMEVETWGEGRRERLWERGTRRWERGDKTGLRAIPGGDMRYGRVVRDLGSSE